MNKAVLLAEIMRLPEDERRELLEEAWESLETRDLPTLSDEELDEIERDLAAHRADPSTAVAWEDVLAELQSVRK